MFYFMRISEGDNPPIYFYSEAMEEPRRFILSHCNFAEFLRNETEKRMKYLATYGRNAL